MNAVIVEDDLVYGANYNSVYSVGWIFGASK